MNIVTVFPPINRLNRHHNRAIHLKDWLVLTFISFYGDFLLIYF